MMSLKIYQVDTFTDQVFGGNPAAICPLEKWLPDILMQKIAAENNLSETAFFVPNASDDSYEIRWFTPTVEIDLCGHATLATAHIIFTEIAPSKEKIRFHTKVDAELIVTFEKDRGLYTLDFPACPGVKVELPDGMLSALCIDKVPVEVYKARDYLLVFENEADVKQMLPNFFALGNMENVFAVIVTAPGDEVDFVSRMFAPSAGVSEDPVCGSAHCTLIPYWAKRLDKDQLHAYQVSARKGELWCENKGERILLSGKAVTYLKAEINI